MYPTKIVGSNMTFRPPQSWDAKANGECVDLPVVIDPPPGTKLAAGQMVDITSAWVPTPEELAQLNAGHAVQLTVYGTVHPPVHLGVTLEQYGQPVPEQQQALPIPGSDDLEEGVSNGEGEVP